MLVFNKQRDDSYNLKRTCEFTTEDGSGVGKKYFD